MRILHVLEATLGGTRRYLENIKDAVYRTPIESGLVYSTLRADAGFLALLPLLRRSGWKTFQIDMCRSVKPGSDLMSLLQLHRVIAEFRPHILHCHSSKAGALGRIAALLDGKPPYVVYSPHALAVNMRRVYHRVEACLSGATDLYAAVSESERRQIIDLGLAAPDAVKVVYPCINAGYFYPMDKLSTRQSLNVAADVPLVVGVGRLTYQKNPTEFLQVIHCLRQKLPNLQAIWVGDGDLDEEFRDVRSRLQLHESVRIVPWTDDVRPYLAASDIAVSTARFESFGYVVAEAIAMERPVVATRVTGTVDIIQDGTNGFLYDLGDVERAAAMILRLLSEADVCRDVQRVGRASIVERFSSSSMRKSLIETYRVPYPSHFSWEPCAAGSVGQL